MKVRSEPNGLSTRARKVCTTHMSFSKRCARLPLRPAATSSASRRSSGDSNWNGVLSIGHHSAHGSRYPCRHHRPRSGQLLKVFGRELPLNHSQALLYFIGAKPGQSANRLSCRSVRRRQLPTWGMAQLYGQSAKRQATTGAGGQINRPHRYLSCESQGVRCRTSARYDCHSPERGKGCKHPVDCRRTRPETSLDRSHVNALADSHELSLAGKPRQRLVDSRSAPQVQQGAGHNSVSRKTPWGEALVGNRP